MPSAGASKPLQKIQPAQFRIRSTFQRITRPAIIAIGVSTGGPEALAKLLPTLPAGFPLPVVVAQHMPPIFTALLAKRLSDKCSLPVLECEPGKLLEPGCIWIAPGDYHMVVRDEGGLIRLRTHQGPRENFCRPSVDVLFRSVAEVFGARSLGIILTGMGQDGLKGCEALGKQNAPIIVQDEATSVVWGMPGFVARAGLAEEILPLDQIGAEMIRRASQQPALHLTH
jgi:two-component system chemotaxis response regulator CheB